MSNRTRITPFGVAATVYGAVFDSIDLDWGERPDHVQVLTLKNSDRWITIGWDTLSAVHDDDADNDDACIWWSLWGRYDGETALIEEGGWRQGERDDIPRLTKLALSLNDNDFRRWLGRSERRRTRAVLPRGFGRD